MKSDELLDAIGGIDPKHVRAAEVMKRRCFFLSVLQSGKACLFRPRSRRKHMPIRLWT